MIQDIHNKIYSSLEGKGREIIYRKGETIFKQGTNVSHIIYIKKGIGKLYIEAENGKNVIIDFSVTGQWVGFITLLNNEGYPYTLSALSDCSIEYFSKDLIMENQSVEGLELLLESQNQLNLYLFDKVTEFGTKNMFGRLAGALLYLSQPRYLEHKIFELLTRKDISEFSGMSIESMVRIMNELKNDKIIVQTGKSLKINDSDLLKRLAKLG